ncbi:MAG: aldehyde ferredoxin oxidoreductase [Promethearchaeota archaeon]|nr:MAG: aldehyde ferredoxin oxidoreductase [Candidatus Lokiarchaeota archaeon]
MLNGGYSGKVLEIDLSTEKIKTKLLSRQFAVQYIGGRGFGARYVWDYTSAETNPLSPSNILIMAAGPLTGLLVPGSGKTSFNSLSPATGIYGDSNIGGHCGLKLKQAGFDILILKGRKERPCYLNIYNNRIEFLSADAYWGKGAVQSEQEIKTDLGDSSAAVVTIGPAGENQVRCAAIQSECRFAGRTGLGAVMGSKNVKAIAIQGDNSIPVADHNRLLATFKRANSYMKNHELSDIWQRQGTLGLVEGVNEVGILPVRNFQEAIVDYIKNLGGNKFEEIYTDWHAHSCLYCTVACEGIANTEKGMRIRPQYETVAMLGSNLDINHISDVVELNHLCNEVGIDTISVGNLVGLLMEAYERKIITKKDCNGVELTWGNPQAVHDLILMICKREGIGNIAADGILNIIKKYPKCKNFAMHCKGLEQSGYDTRPLLGMSLAYATADIGAHHNRAWVAYHELRKKYTLKELAQLVIFHQHFRPLMDCLGACRFPWIEFEIDPSIYSDFYSACVGVETTFQQLMERSEGIYNITRSINLRRGVTRKSDYPPPRTFSEPVPRGPFKGRVLDRQQYDEILSLYYQVRGWDANGIPMKDTLLRLGLQDLVELI